MKYYIVTSTPHTEHTQELNNDISDNNSIEVATGMKRVFNDMEHLYNNHASIWQAYHDKPNGLKELLVEKRNNLDEYAVKMANGTATHREYTHMMLEFATALAYVYEKMTCDK